LTDSGAALHPALHRIAESPTRPAEQQWSRPITVLFVCTGNSVRSPIAEALLRRRDTAHVTVTSAGSRPKRQLPRGPFATLSSKFPGRRHDQLRHQQITPRQTGHEWARTLYPGTGTTRGVVASMPPALHARP
jgi:hypothetical protein